MNSISVFVTDNDPRTLATLRTTARLAVCTYLCSYACMRNRIPIYIDMDPEIFEKGGGQIKEWVGAKPQCSRERKMEDSGDRDSEKTTQNTI